MVETPTETHELVVALNGRMDTAACTAAEESILGQVRGAAGPVVFDLSRVDYVSSMFLRICLKAVQQVGPARFSLRHAGPEIRKVFKIAGFDREIRIE